MDLPSSIEAVTVYRKGAQVRRVATLPKTGALPPTVMVRGLPLTVEDASVRVRIEAGSDGTSTGLPFARDVRVTLDVADRADVAPAPDDKQLRAARMEEARLTALQSQTQGQAARAARLALAVRPPPKKGEPPRASPTGARLALLELRRARMERLLEETRKLEAEVTRARERRIDLEERARRASSARAPKEDELRKAVQITLGGGGAKPSGGARLVVEYTVPGARWAPAYSLRIDEDDKRARLSVRAVVSQRTGEDWTAVQMSLSTADAQRFTELPELASLRIGRAQPPAARRGWRELPPGADELFSDYDHAFADLPLPEAAAAGDALEEDEITAVTDRAVATAAFSYGQVESKTQTRAGSRQRRASNVPVAAARMPAPHPGPPPAGAPMSMPGAAMPTGSSGGYGASPPMQRLAIGAPLAAPAARRSSGMLGGLFEGVGAVAAASFAAPMEEAEAAEDNRRVTAEDRMLAYGDLRMPPPDGANRGRLTLIARQEIYLELMVSQRVHVRHELLAVVDRELAAAYAAGDRAPPPRHHFPTSQAGFDYAYRSDAPVDVPSDGHFHAIPLTAAEAPLALRHVVVPRETQDAFRFAEVPNPLDAPLLEGPADVYVGDDYLLTTDLRVTPPRGKLRLGLGVDSSIKVSRNSSYTEQTTGIIGGSLTSKHTIEIELVNHRKDVADLEVRERVPTVRQDEEDIKVEVADVEPPWKPYEQDEQILRGGHRWRVQVEPGKRQRLRASYLIKIAAKNELVGGNRRER